MLALPPRPTTPIVYSPMEPTAAPAGGGATVDETIAKALQNNQFISLLDTNHASFAVQEGLAALIPSLAKSGVKHLFIEMPRTDTIFVQLQRVRHGWPAPQEVIDGFLAGTLSRQQAKDYFTKNTSLNGYLDPKNVEQNAEIRVRMLEEAKKYGMKVWAADPDMSREQMDHFAKNHAEAISFESQQNRGQGVAANNNECPIKKERSWYEYFSMRWDVWWNQKDYEAAIDKLSNYQKDFMIWRNGIDADVVRFANEKARDSNGTPQKAAFFYGNGHSVNLLVERDIDEYALAAQKANGFAGTKVYNVAVYGSKAGKLCRSSSGKVDSDVMDVDFNFYKTEHAIETNPKQTEEPRINGFDAYRDAYRKDLRERIGLS